METTPSKSATQELGNISINDLAAHVYQSAMTMDTRRQDSIKIRAQGLDSLVEVDTIVAFSAPAGAHEGSGLNNIGEATVIEVSSGGIELYYTPGQGHELMASQPSGILPMFSVRNGPMEFEDEALIMPEGLDNHPPVKAEKKAKNPPTKKSTKKSKKPPKQKKVLQQPIPEEESGFEQTPTNSRGLAKYQIASAVVDKAFENFEQNRMDRSITVRGPFDFRVSEATQIRFYDPTRKVDNVIGTAYCVGSSDSARGGQIFEFRFDMEETLQDFPDPTGIVYQYVRGPRLTAPESIEDGRPYVLAQAEALRETPTQAVEPKRKVRKTPQVKKSKTPKPSTNYSPQQVAPITISEEPTSDVKSVAEITSKVTTEFQNAPKITEDQRHPHILREDDPIPRTTNLDDPLGYVLARPLGSGKSAMVKSIKTGRVYNLANPDEARAFGKELLQRYSNNTPKPKLIGGPEK
jgi:hypothetical protein